MGGAGYVVDLAIFNGLQTPALLGAGHPLTARTLAVIAAIAVNYVGNSRWTWADRRGDDRRREVLLFFLFSGIGFSISLACLAISRYLLGLDSRLADNVAANGIGLVLGTAFRYYAYRHLVFVNASRPVARTRLVRPAWLTNKWATIAALCLGVLLLRLPSIGSPASPDEGGFLLVAAQWHPGHSLYGDYWVDRPPLLLTLFAVAAWLGGIVPLHLIGAVAACAVVFLAARVSLDLKVPPVLVALVTGGFVSTELFDSFQTSGELLAIPWVLAGIWLWLRADRSARSGASPQARWPSLGYAAAAGVAGACAVLIKQNFIGVFVFVGVWSVAALVLRDRSLLGSRLLATGAGALATVALVLTGAWLRGTSPAGVWEAAVVFRAQAGAVIAAYGAAANSSRIARYPIVVLASGLLLVLVLILVSRWRHLPSSLPRALAPATAGLLVWECAAIVLGGSYWLHYLLGLLPGLVLGMIIVTSHAGWRRTALRATGAWVVVSAVAAAVGYAVMGPVWSPSIAMAGWLEQHDRAGDSAVVAYGQPNILQTADLPSPYPQLWSLPVRVKDPQLSALDGVLRSSDAPTWVIVHGESLASWGIDSTAAQQTLDARYRPVASVCGWRVFLRDGVRRPVAGPVSQVCSRPTPSGLIGQLGS